MGVRLYFVHWDSGHESGHYIKDLLCIGPFRTLAEFESAVTSKGSDAKLLLGPRGGFREFTMRN